jgi:hypothetical protein
MIIQVTDEDIANGVRNSCIACPIAIAIKRLVPPNIYVSVAEDIEFWRFGQETGTVALLPAEAGDFIAEFDTTDADQDYTSGFKPFQFHLSAECFMV